MKAIKERPRQAIQARAAAEPRGADFTFLDTLEARILPSFTSGHSAWAGHRRFGMWLVRAFRPRVLVELGTHYGDSYLAFCQTVVQARLTTRCFAVDTWRGDEHSGLYGPEVFERLHADNAPRYGRFSTLLRMTFDDAVSQFSDKTIDLLHIDGLHTYEAVRHDFETWLPKVADGGIVLLHDTQVTNGDFGVWRLWREIAGRYPSFELFHSAGLGILVIGKIPAQLRFLFDQPPMGQERLRRYIQERGRGCE